MSAYTDEYLNSLNARLASVAEDVCRRLLPGGKRIGREWICGGVDGGPGKSMGVELVGDKAGVWHDRASGETGRLLKLWQSNRGLSFQQAVEEAAAFVKMSLPDKEEQASKPLDLNNYTFSPPPVLKSQEDESDAPPPFVEVAAKPFDWRACVEATTDDRLQQLSEWRGYSIEFCRWLREAEMIGVWRGAFAFPVHDNEGKAIRCHYRTENGWAYYPKSGETTPLIVGLYEHSSYTIVAESQWDAFAIMDRLGHHEEPSNLSAVITRGAQANVNFKDLHIPKMIVVPQNDPISKASKTTGRTPAQEWLHRIQESRSIYSELLVSSIPQEYKDANDWIHAVRPSHEEVFDRVVRNASDPALTGVLTSAEILATNTADDPASLIGYEKRFLGKGGSWVLIGPSGIGKSTLTSGIAIHAAGGQVWHGIKFRRPLRTLYVQAENDSGDIKEMLAGAMCAAGLSTEQSKIALENLFWRRECSLTGQDFCRSLESSIRATRAELVVIDPLLSYIGDDISQQKVASTFLRNWLQPVLEQTGCIAILVHHTGKPPKDKKVTNGWSESDFSYLGLGSSDIVNWARAVSVFMAAGVDTGKYQFRITKRGSRSGMTNQFTGESTQSIILEHSRRGLGWVQCQPPEEPPTRGGRIESMSAADVVSALNDGTMTRKDVLIAMLQEKHHVSNRTAREKVDAALALEMVHVAASEQRKGGGKPVTFIAAGPMPSTTAEQMETS